MNKICGYNCEHNKSGVCQISVCDKRLIISDKTEIKHLSQSYYDLHEKYYKLQKENKILKQNAENNNKVVDKITYTIKPSFTTRKLKQLQKENKQLKDNWNKLKEIVKSQSGFKKRADLKGGLWFEIDELLDKMQELEQGSDSNGQ